MNREQADPGLHLTDGAIVLILGSWFHSCEPCPSELSFEGVEPDLLHWVMLQQGTHFCVSTLALTLAKAPETARAL